MPEHPGTILFVDHVLGTETVRQAADVPPFIAFADDVPVVRIVITATENNGRCIASFGADGELLHTNHMIDRSEAQPMRGNSGLTLPSSSAAMTRKSSGWLRSWAASSYRTLSQLLAKLKLR